MDTPSLYEPTPFLPCVHITDDQILAVLMGETVTIQGPKYVHTISLTTGEQAARNPFTVVFSLGVITADEENLRLIRFI